MASHPPGFRMCVLETALYRQRLRALGDRKRALDKFLAPISGGPAHPDAEDDGCPNVVSVVQLEFGKARANVGLAHEDVQPGVCIDVVPVRMEEDRLLAYAHNLKIQPVSVWIARREFRYEIEISPVAIPFDVESLQP